MFTQLLQRSGQRLGEEQSFVSTTVGLHRRPGSIGREFEQWRDICQLRSPIGELFFQPLTLQPVSLPDREVCVLNRQLLKWRRASGNVRVVERREFLDEYAHGPPIRNDVMHRQ